MIALPPLPHAGRMSLLAGVEAWSAQRIRCTAVSHLAADNPLRRHGRLASLCGAEYGLQAAAAHGVLLTQARPGYLAALRGVAILAPRLDVVAFGALRVEAELLLEDAGGSIYDFAVLAEDGAMLVRGRGVVRNEV